MKKFKYIYDIKSGHYIKKHINEDDLSQQSSSDMSSTSNTNNQDNTNQNQENNKQEIKSINSNEDILKIIIENQLNDKKYQDDILQQNKLLETAKLKATEKNYNGPYDPTLVDPDVLNILKKINLINKQYYIKKCEIEDKRLNILLKLSLETNESKMYTNLPNKYKKLLNESNLNSAKVYMKELVGTEDLILKNMHDFKKVFKNTNLIYGKDNKGYFVVAIDSDDLNLLSNTLEEQGYLRDEVLDTVMPQILDRSSLIH